MQYRDLFLWYFWVQAFALGGSFLAHSWLRRLPDHGYGLGKAAGVLFGAFFYWALVTLGWSANTTGAAAFGLVALWGVGIAARRAVQTGAMEPAPNLRSLLPAIIAAEIVFAATFLAWTYVRAWTPEILESGGEKFMEIMMINAVLRSPTFPPNDAWLSGLPISYYYFGYIMFAQQIKLSGVASAIAFNLGGAMIPALAAAGATSLGYNLWAARRPTQRGAAIVAGVLTALMATASGNLGGVAGLLRCTDTLPDSTWQFLDVREIATRKEQCSGIAPAGWFPWWWDWSRVVKDIDVTGREQEIITEAPAFSLMLGDNHPHTLALPFLILALGVALSQLLYRGHMREDGALTFGSFALNAIAIGAIGFLNTIDLPMIALAFLAARLLAFRAHSESLVLPVLTGVLTLATAYLLYLPFHVTLQTQAQGLMPNLFNGTRLTQFLLHFAPLIAAILAFVPLAVKSTTLTTTALLKRSGLLLLVVLIGAATVVALFAFASREARDLLAEYQNTGSALGASGEQIRARLVDRLSAPWTPLLLACIGAVAIAAVLAPARAEDEAPSDRFALLAAAIGAALVFAIEFVFVRDFFGTRLNSVFKFWYQAWTLWAVAGGYALVRLCTAPRLAAKAAGAFAGALLVCGLLWAPLAAPAKWSFSKNFNRDLPTLDGAAWLQGAHREDAQAIEWLNANVAGAPVILESSHNGSYDYRGRISAFTGLPAVLGWSFHEYQWRGSMQTQDARRADIDALYSTTDLNEARGLLRRYKIEYVIVGSAEREIRGDNAAYPEEGLTKFADLCASVFTAGSTTIYQCAAP
jgi:YYY domain-containing protein